MEPKAIYLQQIFSPFIVKFKKIGFSAPLRVKRLAIIQKLTFSNSLLHCRCRFIMLESKSSRQVSSAKNLGVLWSAFGRSFI